MRLDLENKVRYEVYVPWSYDPKATPGYRILWGWVPYKWWHPAHQIQRLRTPKGTRRYYRKANLR